MRLKMKNVNIMGVHQFLGERGHKKTIYMGDCLKSGAWQIIGRGKFRGGGGAVDTSMHTMN